MYRRKQHARVWAAIPVILVILAISLIAGPMANAADLKLASSGFVVGVVLVLIGWLLSLETAAIGNDR